MKKRILAYLLILTAAVSCYKDLSTEAGEPLPDLVVSGLEPELNVVFGQTINVGVTARMTGRNASDFDYLWEIDLMADSPKDRVELGREPELEYRVTNTPNNTPYCLTVTVTERQSGFTLTKNCFLHVGSSLGEGLLVAYTRDGGKTSEFDLVAAPSITYDYTGSTRYTRGIYALANNGATFEGRVNALLETVGTDGAVHNENRIMVATDEHLTAIDPLTFVPKEQDAQLFNSTKITSFGTSTLFNCATYSTYAFIEGDVYGFITNIERLYGKVAFNRTPRDFFRPDNYGAVNSTSQGRWAVFDDNTGKFYGMQGYRVYNGALEELNTKFPFSTAGMTCKMGGALKGDCIAFLLRDEAGKYYVPIIEFSSSSAPDSYSSYELTAERLDEAVSVAFCDNGNLMYYATPDAIYAVLLMGSAPTVRKLTWKPDSADERITRIRQYTQAWYGTHQYGPTDYPFTLPANRSQLIITTHNDKTGEGKVYLRGFSVSTGLFTFTGDGGTFSGFGEITAMCTTLR